MSKTIPTYQSEGKLPVIPTRAIATPSDISELTAPEAEKAQMGVSIAKIGGQIMDVAIREAAEYKQLKESADRADMANQQRIWADEFERSLAQRNDPENWISDFDTQSKAHIESQLGRITDTNQKIMAQQELERNAVIGHSRISNLADAKTNENRTKNLDKSVTIGLNDQDFPGTLKDIESAYDSGYISTNQYQAYLAQYALAYGISLPSTEAVRKWLMVKEKEGGFINIPQLEFPMRERVYDSLITTFENMKILQVQSKKDRIETQKTTLMAAVEKGTLNSVTADKLAPEVSESDKKKYVNMTGKKNPAFTDAGYSQGYSILLDYWAGGITKDGAAKQLFDKRYSERNLDNDNYGYFGRLLNISYPPEASIALRETRQRIGGENRQTTEYIRSMLIWLTQKSDPDRNKYPSARDIYVQSAQQATILGLQRSVEPVTSLYTIGQTITRGGKQWKITGFDTDGVPLVEEIK